MNRVILSCVTSEQYVSIVKDEVQASLDRGELRSYSFEGSNLSLDHFLELVFLYLCKEASEHVEFFNLQLSEESYCLGRRTVVEDDDDSAEAQFESNQIFREQLVEQTKKHWDNTLLQAFLCCLSVCESVPALTAKGRQILLDKAFPYKSVIQE